MPERNLVSPNSFKILLVAISLVAMQVGCSKLRNNSSFLNHDYLTVEEPNFNQAPAVTQVAETARQAETPGRFVNDPKIALDELIELRGEFVEDVAMDEDPSDIIDDVDGVDAEIAAVAREAIKNGFGEDMSNAVSPPAPSIKEAVSAVNAGVWDDADEQPQSSRQIAKVSFEADMDTAVGNSYQSGDKALKVMDAAAVRDPIRLTGTAPSQLRPVNPAVQTSSETSKVIKLSAIKPISIPEKTNDAADCNHLDCDCMKPKLKPELPFAQPVSFPQTNQKAQVPPTTPLSRPLSPIRIDQAHRQVEGVDQASMKTNSLRTELNSDTTSESARQTVQSHLARAPSLPAARSKRMNAFEPIETPTRPLVVEEKMGPAMAPIGEVNTKIAGANPTDGMPKTKYPGFESPSECQSCQSNQCDGSCNSQDDQVVEQFKVEQTGFVPTETREPTRPENVVIVATTNNDTIPPFAEHPDLDEALPVNKLTQQMNPFVAQISQSGAASAIEQAAKEIFAEAMQQPNLPAVDTNAFTPKPTDFVATTPTGNAMQASHVTDQPPLAVANEFTPKSADIDSVEAIEAQDLTEQEWTDIFGPVDMPTQNANVKSCCSECGTDTCTDGCCGDATQQLVNANFAPPTPIEIPVQQVPAKIANEFVPNQSLPASHQTEVDSSDSVAWDAPARGAISVSWDAPATSNFNPVSPTTNPVIEPGPVATPFPTVSAKSESTATADSDTADVPDSDVPDSDVMPAADSTSVSDDSASASDEPAVVVEIIDNTVPWDVKLDESIESVRDQIVKEGDPLTRNGMEVNLRLLEVLQRQLLTAEENTSAMSNPEREFWQHQLDAITMMLPGNPDASDMDRHNAAYLTLHHLRKAVVRLEAIAKLSVANGAFCTEISGFGKFKPFSNTTFKPGQRTLVYCEVENYMSNAQVENSQTNYQTKLRGSYVVYDEQGRAVQQAEYPIVEDLARQRRRDFYLYFPIQIGELAPGNYRLDLLVEDLSNNKTASLNPGMKFQVEK